MDFPDKIIKGDGIRQVEYIREDRKGANMKNITEGQHEAIKDFFYDNGIELEWRLIHTSIDFDDFSKTVTIKIDNMSEEEYKWFKEGL